MPYLGPLPPDTNPDLEETFATYQRLLGYTPSTILIMQRRPRLVKALAQMASAVWDPAGEVDTGLKRLIAYMASRTHGCAYSMAHSAEAAHRAGVSDEKIAAILDLQNKPAVYGCGACRDRVRRRGCVPAECRDRSAFRAHEATLERRADRRNRGRRGAERIPQSLERHDGAATRA